MKKSYTLHDLPSQERPRERLARLGAEALSTQELIALILGRGVAGEPVMTTAQKLLSHFGSIDSLLSSSIEDLQQIRGIGFAKACQIVACMEVSRRLKKDQVKSPRAKLTSPQHIVDILHDRIGHHKKEHFVLLSLDTRNRLINIDSISIGTLNASLVHPRELFEIAIRRHAASIVIAHNHPSGDPDPSDEDIRVTEKIFQAGKIMGIQVLDHIIIGDRSYFSFVDQNLV